MNTSYQYDALSRLLSVLHKRGATTIDGASYTVDAVGNRTAKTDLRGNGTSNYTYDAIYQLTQVVRGTTTREAYTYDAVGNRLSSLGVSPYTYNSSNQLTSVQGANFTYDNNGNTQTTSFSSFMASGVWDFENRLTSVTLPGGAVVSFKYDPFGRRIQKSSAAGTTIYVYDRDNLLEEVNGTGAVTARYTQGLGIDEPLAMMRGGTTSYYEADGLGSVTSLTSSTGAIAASYAYDSFGNPIAATGAISNPFLYTAREFDLETGLYYYRARYYDSTIGRFLSEDPLQYAGGRNFFVYVGSNPTNFLDPLGLKPCSLPIVPADPKLRKAPKLTRCPSQDLVDCLIQTESGGNPNAVSPKGARGKMQVTPPAIAELKQQSLIGDQYDLDQVGMLYLKLLLTSCDSTSNALAAYNAGPTAVNAAGGIPNIKETQDYVKKINACLEKKGVKGGVEGPNATICCQ